MNGTNNAKLTKHSQRLRKEMTAEEKQLWYQFLKKTPFTFHRQKVIGAYIVDFYCAKAMLVIELDGTQHYETDGQKDSAKAKHSTLRNMPYSLCFFTVNAPFGFDGYSFYIVSYFSANFHSLL